MIQTDLFEKHLTGYTLELVQHLIKTEQAKVAVLKYIEELMHVPREEALRFYKSYKDSL